MTRPLLLDLFCCAGGAAKGYHDAGFDVVGVDIKPQPHYPFEFVQKDALDFLIEDMWSMGGFFSAVHASPPCQSYSKAVKKANRPKHADLVKPTRDLLKETGLPYVIENVPRAPLINPIQLCGSAFGLPIQRHRLFESNVTMMSPGCAHSAYPRIYPPAWNRTTKLRVLSISGGYTAPVDIEIHKAAMGIDWDVTPKELSESIPPAYTEYIGTALIEHINRKALA